MTASHAWRDSRGQAVSARSTGHLIQRADRVPGSVSLEELARLSAAPLSALVIEHSELNNWLGLPNAELWADQYRAKSARLKAIWQTIKRRFPEYAARGGKL